MSLSGDIVVMRNGRSTSQVSIFNYPEHLNPFYEDDQHKRLRFWKINKSSDKEPRRSSFSLSGLRDTWAFKTFRLKKKSSTLGINKTSESPPPLRRDLRIGSLTMAGTGSADLYSPRVQSYSPGTMSNFERNTTWRRSEQSISSTPEYQRYPQQQQRFTMPQKKSSSLISAGSTNPFEEDEPLSKTHTPNINRRKKSRAPPPPVAVTTSNGTLNSFTNSSQEQQKQEQEQSSTLADISHQLEEVAQLTAQIESFVRNTCTDDDESSTPPAKAEAATAAVKPKTKLTSPTTPPPPPPKSSSLSTASPAVVIENTTVVTTVTKPQAAPRKHSADVVADNGATKGSEKIIEPASQTTKKEERSEHIKTVNLTNGSVVKDEKPVFLPSKVNDDSIKITEKLCIVETTTTTQTTNTRTKSDKTPVQLEAKISNFQPARIASKSSPSPLPRRKSSSSSQRFIDGERRYTFEDNTKETLVAPALAKSVEIYSTVKKDTVQKDTVQKDTAQKSIVQKDTIPRDVVQKDTIQKDTVQKDTVQKDTVQKDTVQTHETPAVEVECKKSPTVSPAPVKASENIVTVRDITFSPSSPSTSTPVAVRESTSFKSIDKSKRKVEISFEPLKPEAEIVTVEDIHKRPRRPSKDRNVDLHDSTVANSLKIVENHETTNNISSARGTSSTFQSPPSMRRTNADFSLSSSYNEPTSFVNWKKSTLAPLPTNIPPERKKSVSEIIESINRSQRLLNAAANQNKDATTNHHKYDFGSPNNIYTPPNSSAPSSPEMGNISGATGGGVTRRFELVSNANNGEGDVPQRRIVLHEQNIPTTVRDYDDNTAEACSYIEIYHNNNNNNNDNSLDSNKLNNNTTTFQNYKVTKESNNMRESSPTSSNLDWNPIPKPKRTKNVFEFE